MSEKMYGYVAVSEDEKPVLHSRVASTATLLTLPGQTRNERSLSTQSLIEKPLPSPGAWDSIALGTSRIQHGTERKLGALRKIGAVWGGWRMTVGAGTMVAVAVLIVNIVILGWSFNQPWDPTTSSRTLKQGSCDRTNAVFTFSHLAINILSTILLGTSNAAMQCLSAPTRAAIDRAHAAGQWLDVGISGFRNWSYMDKWRQCCWLLLLFSTVPLHLFYNSAIFSTATANEYVVWAVPSNYLDLPIPPANGSDPMMHGLIRDALINMTELARAHSDKVVELPNGACIDAYKDPLMNQYSNLLLIIDEVHEELPMMSFHLHPTYNNSERGYNYSPYSTPNQAPIDRWACRGTTCDTAWFQAHPSQWNISSNGQLSSEDPNFFYDAPIWRNETSGALVKSCIAQKTEPECTIQLAPQIMGVVIACNVVKVICFLLAIRVRTFKPLITLGDALASFLNQPDPQTIDAGALSAADVRSASERARVRAINKGTKNPLLCRDTSIESDLTSKLPINFHPWSESGKRWFSGASGVRWGMTYVLMATVILTGWALFGISEVFAGVTFNQMASRGLGRVDPGSLISATQGLKIFEIVLLANIFQLVLSFTYLSYNGLLTCILLSHEFTAFAHRRMGLRVSAPHGRYQRSSYWLSLPYGFALPLLALSGLLHWSLSQSVFLAEVKVNTPDGNPDPDYSVSCLGFSVNGLLLTLILAMTMILSPLLLGWVRHRPGTPIVESNSLAISAACHSYAMHPDESMQLLKYGVLTGQNEQLVGLGSSAVTPLAPGVRYSSRRELSEVELSQMSSASVPIPRQQRIWIYVLFTLHLSKLAAVIVFFPIGMVFGKVFSQTDLDEAFISIVTGIALMGVYLVGRFITAEVRRRKKWHFRLFGWHVIPEALWFVVWALFLAVNNNPYVFRSDTSSYTVSFDSGYRVNSFTVVSGWLMGSFLASTIIEAWLWWKQNQQETSRTKRPIIEET